MFELAVRWVVGGTQEACVYGGGLANRCIILTCSCTNRE